MHYVFVAKQTKLGTIGEFMNRSEYLDFLINENGYFLVGLGYLVIYGYPFVNAYGTVKDFLVQKRVAQRQS